MTKALTWEMESESHGQQLWALNHVCGGRTVSWTDPTPLRLGS